LKLSLLESDVAPEPRLIRL